MIFRTFAQIEKIFSLIASKFFGFSSFCCFASKFEARRIFSFSLKIFSKFNNFLREKTFFVARRIFSFHFCSSTSFRVRKRKRRIFVSKFRWKTFKSFSSSSSATIRVEFSTNFTFSVFFNGKIRREKTKFFSSIKKLVELRFRDTSNMDSSFSNRENLRRK